MYLHSLEPFIVFLQQLASKKDLVGEAIIEGGIMDYLLHLYVLNLADPLTEGCPSDSHRTLESFGVQCNSLLHILSGTRQGLSLMRQHPLHILWPTHPDLPFAPRMLDRTIRRAEMWKTLGSELVLWRIHSVLEMEIWHKLAACLDNRELTLDLMVDVLEFSGWVSVKQLLYLFLFT